MDVKPDEFFKTLDAFCTAFDKALKEVTLQEQAKTRKEGVEKKVGWRCRVSHAYCPLASVPSRREVSLSSCCLYTGVDVILAHSLIGKLLSFSRHSFFVCHCVC
jgi:hypothetical protein